jgi:hypothetical protein
MQVSWVHANYRAFNWGIFHLLSTVKWLKAEARCSMCSASSDIDPSNTHRYQTMFGTGCVTLDFLVSCLQQQCEIIVRQQLPYLESRQLLQVSKASDPITGIWRHVIAATKFPEADSAITVKKTFYYIHSSWTLTMWSTA